MTLNLTSISYRGKDLLEATNMPLKASLEFKILIQEIQEMGEISSLEQFNMVISPKLKSFAAIVPIASKLDFPVAPRHAT